MKNPYGIRDGKTVSVDEVERGLACNCTCPSCGERLEANKGDIRLPYFSHYRGAECGAGYETALHLLAKEALAEARRLLLPPLRVRPDKSVWRVGTKSNHIQIVNKGEWISFDKVSIEHALGGIIPDIVLEKQGRKLLVEIKVTHGVDAEKLAKIEDLNISTIEFDFGKADRAISAYLRKLTIFRALDRRRKRRGNVPLNQDGFPSVELSPHDEAVRHELAERLRDLIATLPEREGAVFALRYLEGLPNPEIAEALEISTGAVAAALHKVRSKLEAAVAESRSGE